MTLLFYQNVEVSEDSFKGRGKKYHNCKGMCKVCEKNCGDISNRRKEEGMHANQQYCINISTLSMKPSKFIELMHIYLFRKIINFRLLF